MYILLCNLRITNDYFVAPNKKHQHNNQAASLVINDRVYIFLETGNINKARRAKRSGILVNYEKNSYCQAISIDSAFSIRILWQDQ